MEGNYETFAQFEFKDTIISQYSIAYNLHSEYLAKPNQITKKKARLAIMKLSLPLFPKAYILRDREAVDYLAYFNQHPEKYNLIDIHAVFLICQRIIEKIGLTRFESFKLPKHKAYLEND